MLDLQSFKGFTAGPWSAFAPDSESRFARFTIERLASNPMIPSRKIAVVNADKGNMEANARLAAAAPDLLALAIKQEAEIKRLREALSKCLNYLENTEGELGITLDSAIAARKALEPSHA